MINFNIFNSFNVTFKSKELKCVGLNKQKQSIGHKSEETPRSKLKYVNRTRDAKLDQIKIDHKNNNKRK